MKKMPIKQMNQNVPISPSAGRDHLVDILEEFLRSGGLDRLLWSYCQGQGPRDSPQLREALLGRLAGLPDLTANRLHPHNRELFLPERYCALLANALTSALRLHQRLPHFQLSRAFLSQALQEDSCHYLLYSLILVNSYPITSILLVVLVVFT